MSNVTDILARTKALEKKCGLLCLAAYDHQAPAVAAYAYLGTALASRMPWISQMVKNHTAYRYDKYLVQDKPKAKVLDKKGDRFEQQVEDLELEAQNISEVHNHQLLRAYPL